MSDSNAPRPVTRREKPERITASGLIARRNWTKALIVTFAGTPDETVANPRNRNAPIRLYCLARIRRIEKGKTFQRAFELAQKRKVSAARAVSRKANELEEWVRGLPELSEYAPAELTDRAIAQYNDCGPAPGREDSWTPASGRSDADFLDRVTANYVRHVLTTYEPEMTRTRGRVGADAARDRIRDRILDAIADAYPWLDAACERQRERYRVQRESR